MIYIKVFWKMSLEEYSTEPIEFYYEVQNNKLNRGLEVFIDRTYQLLPPNLIIPTLEEMNNAADTFTAFEIRKSEFEYHWFQAMKQAENG